MKFTVVLATLLAVTASAFSATIYVPANHATIQGAIDASADGDTIIVSPGTYVENIEFKGKKIHLKSEEGPQTTVIDGGSPPNPDYGSVVRFVLGEESTSILEGFTITNGKGSYFPVSGNRWCGGGILCDRTSPTIVENIIVGNDVGSSGYGGGIFLYSTDTEVATPRVESNTITANDGNYGAGIFTKYTDADIRANTIIRNVAESGGGGIACWQPSRPTIADNVIAWNTAKGEGGGIRCYGYTSLVIVNNTIFGNEADVSGGGIYSKESDTTVANTILWENIAPQGKEISVDIYSRSSILTISHSDVEGGQSPVYVHPQAQLNWGAGMIGADPLFAGSASDDLHLTWGSPCRNAGDNLSVPTTSDFDFEGDPRIVEGTADMGADELFPHLFYTGTASPGASVSVYITGEPGERLMLALSNKVVGPTPTPHGDLYLKLPLLAQWNLGDMDPSGVYVLNSTIPSNWKPGSSFALQALVGTWGKKAILTNLMLVEVE